MVTIATNQNIQHSEDRFLDQSVKKDPLLKFLRKFNPPEPRNLSQRPLESPSFDGCSCLFGIGSAIGSFFRPEQSLITHEDDMQTSRNNNGLLDTQLQFGDGTRLRLERSQSAPISRKRQEVNNQDHRRIHSDTALNRTSNSSANNMRARLVSFSEQYEIFEFIEDKDKQAHFQTVEEEKDNRARAHNRSLEDYHQRGTAPAEFVLSDTE